MEPIGVHKYTAASAGFTLLPERERDNYMQLLVQSETCAVSGDSIRSTLPQTGGA